LSPNGSGTVSYVYAIGRVEARFPNLAAEKEFAQATGRTDTAGKTDQQTFHAVLSKREHRYLVRQLCWVLTIQGLDTYLLVPRDPADIDLLVEAIRPAPSANDIDVVVDRLVVPEPGTDETASSRIADSVETTLKAGQGVMIVATMDRDPATTRFIEPVLYYKGFHAIQTHRLAHWLHGKGRKDFALYLQSRSSAVFQCDIHPAANVGRGIFLDHATTGDGVIAALAVLAIMLEEQQPLSKLAQVMTRYPQVLVNIKVGAKRDGGSYEKRSGRFYAWAKVGACPLCKKFSLTLFSWDGFHQRTGVWARRFPLPEASLDKLAGWTQPDTCQ